MKKILLIIAVTAAGAGYSVANATGTSPIPTDTIPVLEVQESAYKGNAAAARSFEEFRGSYAMEDGSMLTLYRHGSTFYAELNGQPATPIRAMTSAKFIAMDGRTTISFAQLPNGLVSQVVVTRPVNGRMVSLHGGVLGHG
jgi:hypothetical protein